MLAIGQVINTSIDAVEVVSREPFRERRGMGGRIPHPDRRNPL
jgi:hypothetical protein